MSKRKRREHRGRSGSTASATQPRVNHLASSTPSPTTSATRRPGTPSRRPKTLSDRLRNPGRVELLGAAVVVVAIVAAIYLLVVPGFTVGRYVASEGRGHVAEGQPISYKNTPPSSGTHYPSTVPWGVYQEEVAEGYWVHNLEHGGVVLLYNCPDGCPELKQQLEETFKTFPPGKYGQVKLVVTPYSKMEHRIAAVAWEWILELDTFDREQLLTFYREHVDRGPEDVP